MVAKINETLPLVGGRDLRLAANEPKTRPAERTPEGEVLVKLPKLEVVGDGDTGKIKIVQTR